MKKLILSIFIITIFYFLFNDQAHAETFDIGVYPPIIQINAIPPISVRTPFAVQNFSDQTQNLSIQIHPFLPSNSNNGSINILWNQEISGPDNDIDRKIELIDDQNKVITQLTLAPKQQKKLFIHVGLPKDEPPFDYYFTIIFVSKDSLRNQNTSSLLQGAVGMNVLLSVGPYKNPTGYLEKFSAPLIVGHGPIPIKVLVNNTNSFFINPKGNLVIYDMFNQIIGKVNLLSVNVLGNSKRYLPDDKSGSLNSAIWNQKALFGFYRIRLSLLLTPNGPLFEKNIYFLALPWQAIFGIIIFCGLGTVTFLAVREKLRKN